MTVALALRGLLLLTLVVAGCSLQMPADPGGTLDDVRSGVLRVGASPEGELVRTDDGSVSGSEAALVKAFAESLDAEIEWTIGSEESLVDMLAHDELDVLIGGITDQTPWSSDVGMTRGYPGIPGSGGKPLVFLVEPGENRFLSELEQFLDQEVG